MKRIVKRTIPILTAVLLAVFFPASVLAGQAPAKEEVVYANLGYDGSVENLYVVNAFDVTQAGTVTDHGEYTATRNLSTDGAIAANGDAVTFDAPISSASRIAGSSQPGGATRTTASIHSLSSSRRNGSASSGSSPSRANAFGLSSPSRSPRPAVTRTAQTPDGTGRS